MRHCVGLFHPAPEQRLLSQVTPEDLARHQFAAGSMGPKVEAAVRFAAKTGGRAGIGSLADITESSREGRPVAVSGEPTVR